MFSLQLFSFNYYHEITVVNTMQWYAEISTPGSFSLDKTTGNAW